MKESIRTKKIINTNLHRKKIRIGSSFNIKMSESGNRKQSKSKNNKQSMFIWTNHMITIMSKGPTKIEWSFKLHFYKFLSEPKLKKIKKKKHLLPFNFHIFFCFFRLFYFTSSFFFLLEEWVFMKNETQIIVISSIPVNKKFVCWMHAIFSRTDQKEFSNFSENS